MDWFRIEKRVLDVKGLLQVRYRHNEAAAKGQAYGCIQLSGGCVRHRALQMGFGSDWMYM
jgi:hypothetical protein